MTPINVTSDLVYDLLIDEDIQLACRRSGLYKRVDAAWQPAYESFGLAANPATISVARGGQALFAGVEGGIMVSPDLGASWQAFQLPAPPTTVSDLQIVPDDDDGHTVIAATLEDGIYRSEDGGETWQAWNGGLFDRRVLCLASTSDSVGAVLAGTASGLYRSHNAGRSWQAVDLPCDPDTILSLYAEPKGQLVAGTEAHGLFVSTDSGATWQPPGGATRPEGPINAVIAADNQLLALIADQLWMTSDPDNLWQPVLANKSITAVAAPDGLYRGARLITGYADGAVREDTLAV